jgi:hypothetical protein
MRWWKQAHRSAAEDAMAANPVAMAIQEKVTAPFTGTTGQLHALIGMAIYEHSGDLWGVPKVGLEMPRAVDALTKLGWQIERGQPDHKHQRQWAIVPPAAQDGQISGTVTPGIHQQIQGW